MNKTITIGRLTKDPQLAYTENGMAVCRFTVACDSASKNKDADFIPYKAFDKTAELIDRYMSKGRQIAIEGHQTSGNYKNKEGKMIYTLDNIADRVEFLGSAEKSVEPTSEENTAQDFQEVYDDCPF